MQFVLGIVLWFIGLWILYLVIRNAIDGSQTAENIRDIKRILSKQYLDANNNDNHKPKKNYEVLNVPVDECPACHSFNMLHIS